MFVQSEESKAELITTDKWWLFWPYWINILEGNFHILHTHFFVLHRVKRTKLNWLQQKMVGVFTIWDDNPTWTKHSHVTYSFSCMVQSEELEKIIDHSRQMVIAFIWSNNPTRKNIHILCTKFLVKRAK